MTNLIQRTTLSASNSTSEENIVAFTVPDDGSGGIIDGDILVLTAYVEKQNNSGSTATLALRLKFGAQSVDIVTGLSVVSGATLYKNHFQILLSRDGDALHVSYRSPASALASGAASFGSTTNGSFASLTLSGLDFTQSNDLRVTAQWSLANAATTITCKGANLSNA